MARTSKFFFGKMLKNSKAFYKADCQLSVENDVGTCNKQYAESPTIRCNDYVVVKFYCVFMMPGGGDLYDGKHKL